MTYRIQAHELNVVTFWIEAETPTEALAQFEALHESGDLPEAEEEIGDTTGAEAVLDESRRDWLPELKEQSNDGRPRC